MIFPLEDVSWDTRGGTRVRLGIRELANTLDLYSLE